MPLQIQEWDKAPDHRKRKVIAVIPARGGSTRLPDKNMRLFAGRPLVAWTIIQAKSALCVDEVWVSSDSEQILEVAYTHGAVPFRRVIEETDDTPGTVPIREVIDAAIEPRDIFVGMFTTSPLRKPDDVDKAVRQYLASNDAEEKFLISVERIHEDYRWEVMNDDCCVPMPPSANNMARFNGLITVCTRDYYDSVVSENGEVYYIPYFTEAWQSDDVNTIDQMRIAELIFYDRILFDGLNPYEVYRKGGLKL